MPKVPFVDFRRLHGPLRESLHAAALRVLDSGKFIGGDEVRAFEDDLAAHTGMPGAVGVACATSGLFAALFGLGIGAGDEVLVPAHTAICTGEAVTLAGAKVVFVDVGPDGGNMDPADAARKVTSRTKAILLVHLYGIPADLDAFEELARRHNLRLIEDCAQAQGARHRGRTVGSIGDAGVFSFFPSKNLGGFGDGGAVVARDAAVLKRVRMFSNHGREDKYLHEFEGINSRLDALQAALLRCCLPHLDTWNAHRRRAASLYRLRLAGIRGLRLPTILPDTEAVFHLFVVRVADRAAFQKALKDQGVESAVHYPHPLHLMPAYARLGHRPGDFPNAEDACATCVSLPMHPHIDEEEVRAVADAARQALAS